MASSSGPVSRSGGGTWIGRLLSGYGMGVVLLLICAYYSWATLAPQQPVGKDAAKAAMKLIRREVPKGAHVLIVARQGEEDTVYADTLENDLKGAGYAVAGKVTGEPRDARRALKRIDEAGESLTIIAATPESAAWPVLSDLATKYPKLPGLRVVTPPPVRWPTFLKVGNLRNVADQITIIAIIGIGMTMVIITGGIDLSVGSLIALSSVITALYIRSHGGEQATRTAMIMGAAFGVCVCALTGLFSGTMVTLFRLPPFIVTLAVMLIASGLAYTFSKGNSIYEIPQSFTWLGMGVGWFSIQHEVFLMAVLYVLAHLLMNRTVLGRYVYAVGGNREAARLSGVRVWLVLVLVYTVSGAFAGLGGVIMASQLKSGAPQYGQMYELYVIAAVVVGGTSLNGGEGRVLGSLIGALIIAVIQIGMNQTGVESYTQKVVLGAVILGAVLLDTLKRGWQLPRWFSRAGAVRPQAVRVPVE